MKRPRLSHRARGNITFSVAIIVMASFFTLIGIVGHSNRMQKDRTHDNKVKHCHALGGHLHADEDNPFCYSNDQKILADWSQL